MNAKFKQPVQLVRQFVDRIEDYNGARVAMIVRDGAPVELIEFRRNTAKMDVK
jgi:hypothetical protein